MRYLGCLLFLLCFSKVAVSQTTPEQDSAFEANYQLRIQQETIDGVYIPASLEEAFEQLSHLGDEEGLAKFRAADEEVVATKLRGGLQRWIHINWGFDEGSRLSHLIREMGVKHPEDMAAFVLRSYHRHLNNRDLDYEGQVQELNDARQKKWDAQYKETTEEVMSKEK